MTCYRSCSISKRSATSTSYCNSWSGYGSRLWLCESSSLTTDSLGTKKFSIDYRRWGRGCSWSCYGSYISCSSSGSTWFTNSTTCWAWTLFSWTSYSPLLLPCRSKLCNICNLLASYRSLLLRLELLCWPDVSPAFFSSSMMNSWILSMSGSYRLAMLS